MTANYTIEGYAVQLNGSELTGNTYQCKGFIKAHLGGKWNSERKTWTVDTALIAKHLDKVGGMLRTAEATKSVEHHSHTNGVCPICHTYCYGDCQAH